MIGSYERVCGVFTGTVFGLVGDIRKPESMKEVVEQAAAHMGGLDVLIVNGGNGGREYLVSVCVVSACV